MSTTRFLIAFGCTASQAIVALCGHLTGYPGGTLPWVMTIWALGTIALLAIWAKR